jgi:hypothetical protein
LPLLWTYLGHDLMIDVEALSQVDEANGSQCSDQSRRDHLAALRLELHEREQSVQKI